MSFRYTNNLIGVMKHRILMEKSRRSLLSRTFTGRCNGVTVTYSAHGVVKSIAVSAEDEAKYVSGEGTLNVELLSSSIRTAVWNANRELQLAKEEGYRRSITGNEQLKANPDFTRWFAQDGSSLRPVPYEALTNEFGATESMKTARRDSADAPLGIADVMPEYKSALMVLEQDRTVLTEQRKEMADDEREFWRKVELIRKGQAATLGGREKRSYKDDSQMGATEADASKDKVALKFVH